MTDACALHLSYIVSCHHIPDQLLQYVPPPKAGNPTQQMLAYDTVSGCSGIIYLPNSVLGPTGRKVLELSECERMGSLTPEMDDLPDELQLDGAGNANHRLSEISMSKSASLSSRRRSKGTCFRRVFFLTAVKFRDATPVSGEREFATKTCLARKYAAFKE